MTPHLAWESIRSGTDRRRVVYWRASVDAPGQQPKEKR